VELWTPGAVGDRQITDKNLRKRVREAERAAEGARLAAADAQGEAARHDDGGTEEAGRTA
jgi:tRNA (adenine57-N1/adenine58-N1)-methyltransferase